MNKQASKSSKAVAKSETESGIVRWLGGSVHIDQNIRTDFDIIKAGLAGITKASIDELTHYIGVSKKSMAEDILNMSVKTLERKNPEDKLDKRTSSHALEIARVMQHAFEVFDDEEKVRRWLNRENRGLNNSRPVQLLSTLTGINMISDILIRIEEGVYS